MSVRPGRRRAALIAGIALAAAVLLALSWTAGRFGSDRGGGETAENLIEVRELGLPPLVLPAQASSQPDRIAISALGQKLFFDRRLSFNGTMSCSMCHVPEEGYTSNASRTAVGIEGKSLRRNAPTLLNVAWQKHLFHDGRESNLATQAWLPLLHADEMANPSIGFVLDKIRQLPDYAGAFERVFGGAVASMETVGAALAAFETSLVSARSRFDRWRYGGEQSVLSDREIHGYQLFTSKARCSMCHLIDEHNALFLDQKFHITGVAEGSANSEENGEDNGVAKGVADSEANVQARGSGRTYVVPLAPGVQTTVTDADLAAFASSEPPDLGRFEITLDPNDRRSFRTPSLRNVARTAPYMHNGAFATLDEVIEFYDRGGGAVPAKSQLLAALGLSLDERQALVAFLQSLDGVDSTSASIQRRPLQ